MVCLRHASPKGDARVPPQGIPSLFPANWFDQLGLKRGLQQIPGDGKKRGNATYCANYSIDYIAIYVDTSGVPRALPVDCQA
jgi:hypothetical protein